jgi:predicted ATPase
LEINGFKSFQDFAWDLEPLVMVLGPNSAGKSNLFDALALISRLSQMELPSALRGGHGSIRDQFAHTRDGVAETMSFAVELLLSDPDLSAPLAQTRFRYELTVGRRTLPSGIEELNVLREVLHPIARADDEWITGRPEFAKFARYEANEVLLELVSDLSLVTTLVQDGVDITPDDLRRVQSPRGAVARDRADGTSEIGGMMHRRVPSVVDRTLIAEVGAIAGQHLSAVARELRGWRFLHLGMHALRESSERAASIRLALDGANLPTALAALSGPDRARVQADLVELVPGLTSVQVTATDDEFAIEATFVDGQRYSQRVLSDGTLRLLALLTMLHSAEPGSLVAYEEPENGLFPGRLRELLRRVRSVMSRHDALPVQVLLNGHSPAILAGLLDLPRSLAFADLVRRNDGVRRTRIRRIDTNAKNRDPATLVGMAEVEKLLDAARPEAME